MYKTLNEYYQEKFGSKVYKLSVNGGFTCPNRDGNISSSGCIFCSKSGSGEFTPAVDDIKNMLDNAKKYVEHKNKGGKYIAYFQAFTNTYGPLEKLKSFFIVLLSLNILWDFRWQPGLIVYPKKPLNF